MAEQRKTTFQDVLKALPAKRLLTLAAVAAACFVLFGLIISQARVADYSLLFANLSSEDAAEVLTRLKEQKVAYRLEEGGRSIFIPADQVYETRLELAGAGLPRGGGVGFEIFDKQSFGITDFAQKINYQRALQGELARTISSLAPVEAARVHLALPQKRLFREQQKEATASVIVKLVPGRQLSESQIQGVVHLVVGSVEGLEADMVTVIDASGKILSSPPRESMGGPMTPGMFEYQQAVERSLEGRAQSLLDRALGVNNSLVRVTADLDFSQQEQTEERFDPEATVVRSEQSSQEKSGAELKGGVPGVESNLQGAGGFGGAVPSSRTQETVNYEVSKVVSRKVNAVGNLKQVSVAVLVADKAPAEGGGTAEAAPRSAKELEAIENMVRGALGLLESRGDRIEVVSMPFADVFAGEPLDEPAPGRPIYEYLPFVKYGLLVLGAILVYLLLARPLLRSLSRGSELSLPMKTVEELEAEMGGRRALPSAKEQDPAWQLREQALSQQAPFAQIVRAWLKEG